MKKKRISLLLLAMLLTGCGSGGEKPAVQTEGVMETIAEETAQEPETISEEAARETEAIPEETIRETEAQPDAPAESGTVDVDLTQLSSTMVYSEVYNMMMTPEDYIGKTIRMTGQFAVYDAQPGNESGAERYYAVVIADATACCKQGIEFIWLGEHRYPEDYPEEGTQITVTGVFETYQEGDRMYCHLLADSLS